MTLIGCFRGDGPENMALCLQLQPKRMILLTTQPIALARYRSFLHGRGLDTTLEEQNVSGQCMDTIADTLLQIICAQTECVIDLTGCSEIVSMAVGAVLTRLNPSQRKKVSVQLYDPEGAITRDCDCDGIVRTGGAVALTVPELIGLYGGTIYPDIQNPPPELMPQDIRCLWEQAAADPKQWNRTIAALRELESHADSKTQVYLPLTHIRSGIHNFDEKLGLVRSFLSTLAAEGLVEDNSREHALEYTYRAPVIRDITGKAGDILEYKALLEARSLMVDGKPYFNDCAMGVNIDWDGVLYKRPTQIAETRNEIDLILMHGMIPLFVSCKNGTVGDDELYKLHTVATRFGGPHARKMLIASYLDRGNDSADRAFVQRAWDMDILLVTDAASIAPEEWSAIFQLAML